MKYFNFLLAGLIFIQFSCEPGKQQREKVREKEKQIEIKVSNVKFDQEDGTWTMSGYVKNVNDFEIQGEAEVVLLNKNKNKINEFITSLNEGNPIAPGDSVQFSHQADQSFFAGATGYQVQFVNE